MPPKQPLVRSRSETPSIPCPYGNVQRIVTGGEGGVANVHVVTVTEGSPHAHEAYDEVYYVLSGSGRLTVDGTPYSLAAGTVAVIPAGATHSLASDGEAPLEFVIFGTPPLPIDSDGARPRKPGE